MAKPLIDNETWAIVEAILPAHKPRRFRYPGRKPIDNRQALCGILFVLKTGINWEDLPQELGCGCGMTCWRRLRDWQAAGVWQQLHRVLLARLQGADRIDWSRASVDRRVRGAQERGDRTRLNPYAMAQPGNRPYVVTGVNPIPPAMHLTHAPAGSSLSDFAKSADQSCPAGTRQEIELVDISTS